jgi:hypothetical protein
MDHRLCHTAGSSAIDALRAFAAKVRRGDLGRGHQVGHQTVQVALRAIGTTFELDGQPNPLYRCASSQRYWKALERQIEGYRRQDPPPQAKLAVPVTVPHWAVDHGLAKGSTTKQQAAGDLTLIAFYYLLRVGEYTLTNPKQKRRTKQFRVCDVTFWKAGTILPSTSPRQVLLTADAATLTITNQKNGTKGQVIHHGCTATQHSPITALARRVAHILGHTTDVTTPLCTYYAKKQAKHIRATDINANVKNAVKALGLESAGFTARLVSSHSLRAGGAMAMKLNGADRDTIRKQGRWSSDTFLMYIHEQIAAFSSRLATQMSKHIPFINIRGPSLHQMAATTSTTNRILSF